MIRFHWDQPSLFGDSNMNVTKICRGSSSSRVQPQTDRQYHFHWCPSISKAITGLINQGKQVNIFRWAVTFVSDWQHVIGAQLNQWKVVFTDHRLCLDIYKIQDVDTITASMFFSLVCILKPPIIHLADVMLAAGLYLDKKFISRTAKFFLHLQTAQMHRSPLVTKKKNTKF